MTKQVNAQSPSLQTIFLDKTSNSRVNLSTKVSESTLWPRISFRRDKDNENRIFHHTPTYVLSYDLALTRSNSCFLFFRWKIQQIQRIRTTTRDEAKRNRELLSGVTRTTRIEYFTTPQHTWCHKVWP